MDTNSYVPIQTVPEQFVPGIDPDMDRVIVGQVIS